VHFEAGVAVLVQPGEPLRRMLHDPWPSWPATLVPGCKFVLGEPTANVPLAVSLAAIQVAPHGLDSGSGSDSGGRQQQEQNQQQQHQWQQQQWQ
jgi:hypothetical protein